jgi:MFS family permease
VTAVSVRDGAPLPDVPAAEASAPHRHPHGSGFWAVAFAFLIVMAVATLPSPLYGLYRTRDHLSALTITVVFAIFAGSTIGVLQRDSAVAARIGRRGMMLASVATMMLAMGVLAAWKDLPGLLIGRVITGVSVGLAAGIAIFLVFAARVVSQLATTRLQASRVLELETISMLTGLVLLVISVRLSAPSLALCRAGRRRLRPGTAGTPPLIPRRDLTTTGRRDDMSIYFASVRVQEAAS